MVVLYDKHLCKSHYLNLCEWPFLTAAWLTARTTLPVNMVVLDQYWSCIGSIVMPTLDQNSNASIPYGANIGPLSHCYCLHMGPVLVQYWQNCIWPVNSQYEAIIYTGLIVVPQYWPRTFVYWLSTGWPLNA